MIVLQILQSHDLVETHVDIPHEDHANRRGSAHLSVRRLFGSTFVDPLRELFGISRHKGIMPEPGVDKAVHKHICQIFASRFNLPPPGLREMRLVNILRLLCLEDVKVAGERQKVLRELRVA